MLQFIYGRAATGKTYNVFESIKADLQKSEMVALLVPEQFTFEAERTLLHTLGDKASTNVSVLSFTRLFDEVVRKVGGRVADTINEFDKVILMGRALNSVSDRLLLWGKYVNSSSFIETLLSTVNELKNSAITPNDLDIAAKKSEEGYLKNKLNDLILIYSAYEALLGERFIDPADNTITLYNNLANYKYFEGKTVYIDSFKNFTGAQYKIIDRILSQAKNITVCFTADDLSDGNKIDAFTNVRKTAERIKNLSRKNNCDICEDKKLTQNFYKNKSLDNIEKVITGELPQGGISEKDFCIAKCETIFDEAEFTARTIKKLVRTENYRYKDFVIIARNSESYQSVLETACKNNGVFCFSDKQKGIEYLPLTIFIDSALSLCKSYNTQTVFNLLKTGCTDFTDEEISELENYTYLWNINGKIWNEIWTMNPSGLDANVSDGFEQKIEKINILRGRVTGLINPLRADMKGTPSQMVKALLRLFEKCNVADKLKVITDSYTNQENYYLADCIRQGYDIVMQIFDGIVKCLPDKETTIDNFISCWSQAVRYAKISNIPQMLDEVTFGSADRIRPSRPKVAFIIGANHGVFPALTAKKGLFADNERQRLIDCGLDLYTTEFTYAIDEDYLVYTSLCCPTEKLFITYSTQDSKGTILQPSEMVTTIQNSFQNIKVISEPIYALNDDNIPETANTAVVKMCLLYNKDKNAAITLDAALKDYSNISIDDYIKNADKSRSIIDRETAKKLYGNNLVVSATKFDTFHRCKFSFFCKYGINAHKLQPADFDVLQRGTMVHYVLESVIKQLGIGVGNLTRQQTDALTDKCIEEYLSKIEGFDKISTPRIKFLITKIAAAAKDVVYHIACEFNQSKFEPAYCELKIGNDGHALSAEIPLGGEGKISINGSIDRVDTWNGYVRVVDYKTGSRKFKLSDVLVGLNLQMLIYLYSVIKSKGSPLGELTPAGVLYMPSKRQKDETTLAMNGIILDDDGVIEAMEKLNEGKYIPEHQMGKEGVKGNTYITEDTFEYVFSYIEKLMSNMGENLLEGMAQAQPVDSSVPACKYCDYYSVCCLEEGEHTKTQSLKNGDVLIKIKETLENGN